MKRAYKNRAGFTMVEFIAVIVLSGIIFLGLSQAVIITIRSWDIVLAGSRLITKSEVNLTRMANEIRQIKNKTNLITATSSNIRFIDVNDNDIEYKLSGNQILLNNRVAVSNVSAFSLEYLDKNGTVLSVPAVSPDATDVQMVRLTITVLEGGQSLTTRSLVRFRNVR